MIKVVQVEQSKPMNLDHYAVDAHFATAVADLRAEVAQALPLLKGRRVWMVNSTAQGGGVAEMLPRLLSLLRELGVDVEWVTINTGRREFFGLTKRLHNMIHGEGGGNVALTAQDARLFEEVNRENAESLRPLLSPRDLLVVHDPQPLAMGALLQRELGLPFLWRCHIGLDEHNDATAAAWRFMRPYLEGCDHAAFSAPEYIPSFLSGKVSILHPAIDPLSHKNRPLSVHKMIGILCNAGLQPPHEPVPTEAFHETVERLGPDGAFRVPGELGLLFRPIVLQVSRWDRLKGWRSLLGAFLRMKRRLRDGKLPQLEGRNRKRLELARLVLAGPDPKSIQDDPEGVAVLEELRELYLRLEPWAQEDVALLSLPMGSRKENGLIVNALQRCASVVVQNSLREGFGLTVTEAMWKSQAVLGTQACGIRQQLRDQVDGVLTQAPEDEEEIAGHLTELLVTPARRYQLGRSASRRVHQDFLIFTQVAQYVRLLRKLAEETAGRQRSGAVA